MILLLVGIFQWPISNGPSISFHFSIVANIFPLAEFSSHNVVKIQFIRQNHECSNGAHFSHFEQPVNCAIHLKCLHGFYSIRNWNGRHNTAHTHTSARYTVNAWKMTENFENSNQIYRADCSSDDAAQYQFGNISTIASGQLHHSNGGARSLTLKAFREYSKSRKHNNHNAIENFALPHFSVCSRFSAQLKKKEAFMSSDSNLNIHSNELHSK